MSRELFMLFLVLASVLGGVMGACLWSLRRPDDGNAPLADPPGEAHLPDTAGLSPGRTNADGSTAAAWHPVPVDRHAEAQSRRILSLVSELQAAEEQQMRLQRDLATLRASRQHGGETLHPRMLDGEFDLPVLNRRVSTAFPGVEARNGHKGGSVSGGGSGSELLGLSLALDSTAEIPVMSEEELAGSIDELELEFIGDGNSGQTA